MLSRRVAGSRLFFVPKGGAGCHDYQSGIPETIPKVPEYHEEGGKDKVRRKMPWLSSGRDSAPVLPLLAWTWLVGCMRLVFWPLRWKLPSRCSLCGYCRKSTCGHLLSHLSYADYEVFGCTLLVESCRVSPALTAPVLSRCCETLQTW